MKSLGISFDPSIKDILTLPYTVSFVLRKRKQIDSLNELPKEKRPPEYIIWDKGGEEIDRWIDRVYKNNTNMSDGITITADMIEG